MIGTSLPEQYFRGRAESRSTLPLPLLLLPLLLPELLLLLLSSSLIAAQELAAAEQLRIKPQRLQWQNDCASRGTGLLAASGGQASSQRAGGWQAMQAKSNAVLKAAHKEMQGTAVFIVYILM